MSLIRKAQEDAEEWRERKHDELGEAKNRGHNEPISIKQNAAWNPPMMNLLKFNIDGEWHQQRNNSGVGWICRNEKGQMLWAVAKAGTRLSSSIEAKAEA